MHTHFGINRLLAGILVMTALYSVNLRVMGKSNDFAPVAAHADELRGQSGGDGSFTDKPCCTSAGWEAGPRDVCGLVLAALVAAAFGLLLFAFFRTNMGLAMQAIGDNSRMIRAFGVNVERMTIVALFIGNVVIGLSGALMAQYQGFADVQMGIGMLVWGVASVVLGESLVGSAQDRLSDHRGRDGLGAVSPAGGGRPAVRPQSERSQADHGGLRLRGARSFRRWCRAVRGWCGRAGMLEICRHSRRRFIAGTPNEVRALRGVSLSLERGSFVCVIGTNGSGKSTLAERRLPGRFLPDSGRIELDGIEITRWPEHRRAKLIGRVFQDPFSGTAPSMTIAENLALATRRGQRRGLGWALSTPSIAASCAIAWPA